MDATEWTRSQANTCKQWDTNHTTMDPFEMSAESAPLSPQSLQQALEAAASSTQQLIHAGTRHLQAWESKEGYYSLLQVTWARVVLD